MNVDWVIPCRYIEVHDNLGTLIGAGIDTFWVPQIPPPMPLQISMAIRLSALPEELRPEVQHEGRNIITGPNGSTISEVGGTFVLGGGEQHDRPDWLQGVILPTIVGFEVLEEGTYTFEHIVDGSSKSVPLHVVLGLPPGTAPAE